MAHRTTYKQAVACALANALVDEMMLGRVIHPDAARLVTRYRGAVAHRSYMQLLKREEGF